MTVVTLFFFVISILHLSIRGEGCGRRSLDTDFNYDVVIMCNSVQCLEVPTSVCPIWCL